MMWPWTPDSREAYAWAIRRLKNAGAYRVLDFGCGTGEGTKMLLDAGLDAVGYDREEGCRPDVPFVHGGYPRIIRNRPRWDAALLIRSLESWHVVENIMRDSQMMLVVYDSDEDNLRLGQRMSPPPMISYNEKFMWMEWHRG